MDDSDIKQHSTERFITLVIPKKGPHEHWPRLLKQVGKTSPNIKAGARRHEPPTPAFAAAHARRRACANLCRACTQVDWDKWVDEDEGEEVEDADKMGGFDLSALQNFQNYAGGGMGGIDEMLKGAALPLPLVPDLLLSQLNLVLVCCCPPSRGCACRHGWGHDRRLWCRFIGRRGCA